jgi:hypothetical protein
MKNKLNKLISTINAVKNNLNLKKVEGHFTPGYIYGNAKTHKDQQDPPLRPIISQIPYPTYKVAKSINKLIVPYMPAKYLIKSTDEFINIIRNKGPSGIIASLDVESLFTNVPVRPTIDIILNNVFNHPTLPKPDISESSLESLLLLCTTEAPFYHIDGSIYCQKDGLAMGSPLGPTLANFYMCHIENQVLQNENIAPHIYCRYIDDIFIDVENEDQLVSLQLKMQEASSLNFTYEMNVDNKLPFLDVFIESTRSGYRTSVYTKPSNAQECLNFNSDAPQQYKEGLINTFLNRAYKICSNYETLHTEFIRIKHMLVNNQYPNYLIDEKIRNFLNKKLDNSTTTNNASSTINIYYRNQMTKNYKEDENILRKIVHQYVKPIDPGSSVNLLIYYKNRKLRDLLIKNNLNNTGKSTTEKHNVVYQFTCSEGECMSLNNSYIGFTTMTLSARLYQHRYQGSINKHFKTVHNTRPSKELLENNTTILYQAMKKETLHIIEALHIYRMKPTINDNISDFSCLKLFHRRMQPQDYSIWNTARVVC